MWDPQNYLTSIDVFFRLLGFIYFFVFFPFLYQIKGLIGSNGILPIERFLQAIKLNSGKRAPFIVPTLFWYNCSDKALITAVYTGIFCSILLMFNILTPLMLLFLFLLHLSIVSTGQDFLSFGWELFLLEITFNAFFLSLTSSPNILIWISLNLLLFRFHFQGGAVKLQSKDPNWRNMTGVAYHYQSQPLPNATAWYAHKLPLWFQKFSTAFMLVVELIIPFALFGTDDMRLVVYFFFVGLQLMIWATGNFSYLNHLTVVLSTILLSNAYLEPFFDIPHVANSTPLYLNIPITAVGASLIILQLMNLWNSLFTPNKIFNFIHYIIYPFHIVNRYGIFAVMTTKRNEIVVEGSDDGTTWKEYLFWHKPSELNRRPRRISPCQPRLDWQAWFLPFSRYESEPWFHNFLIKLLYGVPEVTALLRHNPFPDKPPKYIRATAYDYQFSSFAKKKETGNWWTREYIGEYSPVLYLKSQEQTNSE